jgi:hypothetical protein
MVFHYESIEVIIKEKVSDMNIIELKHREYRKDESTFFSRISEYNQLGYIFNSSFHLLKKYMKCINCYSNYENDDKCNYCNYEYSEEKNCFFLNCINIMPFKIYNNLKKKYKLNTINEHYYDQRHVMNSFIKDEIYAAALHPDRIEKILRITGDHWTNISNYI